MDYTIISPLTVDEVYKTGRIKFHPLTGEVLEDVVASRPIFKAVACEERGGRGRPSPQPGPSEGTEDEQGPGSNRAAARARKQLFDLAACNDFDLFITLTLDQKEVDRYDVRGVVKKMGVWLDNRVRRHGLKYIIVPELHKDGALHFHGLISSRGLRLSDSGRKTKDNRPIFNLPEWRYGFTTAVRLSGDYGKVCQYICKYITKSGSAGKVAGRYFYHGGALLHPVVKYYDADWKEVEGKAVEIGDAGLTLVYRK